MSFQQAVTTCLRKYADFSGRACRSEFWWFTLFEIGVLILGALIHETVYSLVALALLLPVLAVSARRLHDIGKSGWWMLISAVPLIGLIFIAWAAKKGEEEANAYGAPPGAPAALMPGAQ